MYQIIPTLVSLISFGLVLSGPVWADDAVSADEHRRGAYTGSIATEYPDWFKTSFLEFEEDIREAAQNDKRVILYFFQDGCPYCNALIERNMSQQNIQELLRTRFDVIAINMWGDREVITVAGDEYTEKSFAEALQVQFTPTLMFFNEQGKIILRLNGYLPPQDLLLALNYVTEKRENRQSYHDYIEVNRAAQAAGELNRQDFFASPPYDLTLPAGGSWPRPLAVFFEQPQCPNCDVLHRQVLADPATRALIERFDVVQLDMWSDTPVTLPGGENVSAREWATRLDIHYAPTIVVFARNGEEVIRSEAYFKVFHSQSIFDYVLNEAYKTQSSFQRYLSVRAETLQEQGIDVDIWR